MHYAIVTGNKYDLLRDDTVMYNSLILAPNISQRKKYVFTTTVLKHCIIILVLTIFLMLIGKGRSVPEGYRLLWVPPLLFGVYFYFSNLKRYFLHSITLSFFTLLLVFRYLITLFLMVLSNNYSAMSYGAATNSEQQFIAILLMTYEMLMIFVTTEICIRVFIKKETEPRQSRKSPYDYPNFVYVIAIAIGLSGLLLYPNLLQGFNFLFVKDQINISNRNTFVTILGYFLRYSQVLLLIMTIKYTLKRMSDKKKVNMFFVLLVSIINIAFMWSANRMTIFIVAGANLAVLTRSFPNKRRLFMTLILLLSIVMVVLLSNYRLFGITGAQIDSGGFTRYSNMSNLEKQFQTYFCGPDSIAGAVAVNEYYNSVITSKTFLNDTFTAVAFIQQLPFFLNDRANATIYFFDIFSNNGGRTGLIIPMIGQGYIYFGFLLSPLFSVLSVIGLFAAERKAHFADDVGYQYVFTLFAMDMAMFVGYNYTLIMQNIIGKIVPLLLIIWVNQHICLRKKEEKKRS